MVSVVTTSAGSAAVDRLAERLDELRPSSPLDPALVLCASPIIAVQLRRGLGRRSRGIAGVRTLTLSTFVERLLRTGLAASGQRLASKAELLVALRAELAREPGMFGSVANHRTTDERLLAVQQELLGVTPAAMNLMEREARGLSTDALRVVREAMENPSIGLTGHRVVEMATEELNRLPAGALGPIILYQPEPLRPYEGRLVQAIAQRTDAEVHLAFTGHRPSDDSYMTRMAGWGLRAEERPAGEVADRAIALDVADPENEVSAAVRILSAQAAVGASLADSAIVYGHADPYAGIIAEQLEAAGLPYGGPGHRSLAKSLSGRTLRRILDLALEGLDRGSFITFVAAAPIDDGHGREAPASLWDRLSRQAGVVDDEHWEDRIANIVTHAGEDTDRTDFDRLALFVADLKEALKLPQSGPWSGFSAWALDTLDRYLLVDERWPEAERLSHDRVRKIVADLALLDALDEPTDPDSFEATVASELSSARMPGFPLGQGIYVGPVSSIAGLAFERVCVVGLVEGQFPRSPREDSLLTDQLRSKAGLLEKVQVADVDIRSVSLAAAASRHPAVLLTSRGDLRSNRSRSWPRSLDPLVETHRSLDSHYAGLAGHGRPASLEDLGLRSLIEHVEADEPVFTHELATSDNVLAVGLRRVLDRSRSELGPFTGRVGRGRINPVERTLSPTALETYARCPRRYLLARVLRIRESERPERIAEITPMQRGTLVHLVLERFLRDMIDQDDVPRPDERWSPDQQAFLMDILAQEVKAAEALGFTGGQVKTALLHRQLIAWMDTFIETDNALRARYQATPIHAEFEFGMDDEPALSEWAGRSMRLRGSVDRVDETADGGLVIIDYKTGRMREFKDFAENPLKEGTRLQLPLYANDVAARLGRDGPRVGVYWLLAENELKAIEVDDELEQDLERAVGAILEGVSDGLFPGIPGDTDTWKNSFQNCRFCEFDRVCPTDRQAEWAHVRHDVALTPISALVEALDPDPLQLPGATQ